MRHVLVATAAAVVVGSCTSQEQPGPFEQAESDAWRVVNRSHRGEDGIFVQATLRTFAYEIASMYARAEREELDQQQLENIVTERLQTQLCIQWLVENSTITVKK